MENKSFLQSYPKYLWFLILSYTMVLVMANWFDARLIHIAGLDTDAGTLIFPFTFLLSDLITEVYGFKQARRAIWCGFLFNFIFLCYGQLVIHLPSPSFQTENNLFNTLLSINARVFIASMISYFCAEPLNSYVIAKLKIKMHGRHMWLRFIASTFIASGLDSFIFCFIAFSGIFASKNIFSLALTMWLIKVCIETIGFPLSIYLAKKLKNNERLDVYDYQTHFNLFKLEANYQKQDNKFI